jgi:ribonuclease HIII
MSNSKYELYEKIKNRLQSTDYVINPCREISYGLQFLIFYRKRSGLLRIYDGKGGLKVDYSQIKDPKLLSQIKNDIEDITKKFEPTKPIVDPNEKDVETFDIEDEDPDDLIGIDESGKGDYFGPLVVAAVRITPELSEQLSGLGITDSKRLSDSSIRYLADIIAKRCQHALIVMGNKSYNTIYTKVKNLNHLLAWSHMKVLEDTLKQGYCPNVLCDQFANASLLKNTLRAKKLDVTLYQRPRAESNLAVACASILARYNFIDQIQKMSESYSFQFPKGSSDHVLNLAEEFVEEFGDAELKIVSKTHFKLTEKLNARRNK